MSQGIEIFLLILGLALAVLAIPTGMLLWIPGLICIAAALALQHRRFGKSS